MQIDLTFGAPRLLSTRFWIFFSTVGGDNNNYYYMPYTTSGTTYCERYTGTASSYTLQSGTLGLYFYASYYNNTTAVNGSATMTFKASEVIHFKNITFDKEVVAGADVTFDILNHDGAVLRSNIQSGEDLRTVISKIGVEFFTLRVNFTRTNTNIKDPIVRSVVMRWDSPMSGGTDFGETKPRISQAGHSGVSSYTTVVSVSGSGYLNSVSQTAHPYTSSGVATGYGYLRIIIDGSTVFEGSFSRGEYSYNSSTSTFNSTVISGPLRFNRSLEVQHHINTTSTSYSVSTTACYILD